MNSPGPSPFDIQNHLYSSFLQRKTADVALRVKGSWKATYFLHRVVLIQSEYFSSLFTSGFSESSPSRYGHSRNGTDEIDVVFDDRNITRAAFEICIARLYGGGPPLYVSPTIMLSASHPLTSSFGNNKVLNDDDFPPNHHHPATPRFLLSLLATSIFLAIPSVASQALTLVLNTINPHTVIQYLNFALGKSVGAADPVKDREAAVGLEQVAQGSTLDHPRYDTATIRKSSIVQDSAITGFSVVQGIVQDSSIEPFDSITSWDEDVEDIPDEKLSCHYGAVSNKIGEACACWLARWALDILEYEESKITRKDLLPSLSSKLIGVTAPEYQQSINKSQNNNTKDFPAIWARGGLTAEWVRALVSADTLFVKGERERYEFAKAVVELRRREGILKEEEVIWNTMFNEGIYYSNMSMDDIVVISQDVSPTTKHPFVNLSVLQAAHWSQSVLRHQISFKPNYNSTNNPFQPSPSSPPPREKELGITLTTADILSKIFPGIQADEVNREKARSYFIVPGDSSLRLGDTGSNRGSDGSPMSMEELFMTSQSPPSASSPLSPDKTAVNVRPTTYPPVDLRTSETNFFGLRSSKYTAAECTSSDPGGKQIWSTHPPFRFSVEFWNLNSLKEKSRLHSHTVWYAGSLFNVYVQIVKKKGQSQLGIYLHRQSSVDPIPLPSSPTRRDARLNETQDQASRNRGSSLSSTLSSTPPPTGHYSPSIHPPSRTSTPTNFTGPSSPTLSASPPSFPSFPGPKVATSSSATPAQHYRDPRPAVSAYFTISCASAIGSSQTRFTSAPDVFSISQSWGWKSSSLRNEEYTEGGEESIPANLDRNDITSFRATVVMGLV